MLVQPNPYRTPSTEARSAGDAQMGRVVVIQLVCMFHLFAVLFSASCFMIDAQSVNHPVVRGILDMGQFLNLFMLCLSLAGFALVTMISITIPKWPLRFRVYLPSIDFVLFVTHFGFAVQAI